MGLVRRPRVGLALIVGLALLALVGATSAVLRNGSEGRPDARASARKSLTNTLVTVPVRRAPLAAWVELTGRVVYPRPPRFRIPSVPTPGPIVTAVSVRPGQIIVDGTLLGTLEGAPIVALSGPLPAYRDLNIGDRGPDVDQLTSALRRRGAPCRCGVALTKTDRDAVKSTLFGGRTAGWGPKAVLPQAAVVWSRGLPFALRRVSWGVGRSATGVLGTGEGAPGLVHAEGLPAGLRVQSGARARVVGLDGRSYRGRVVRASQARVIVRFASEPRTHVNGSIAVSVRRVVSKAAALRVPRAALRPDVDGARGVVLVQRGTSVRRTTVRVLADLGDDYAIAAKGLHRGDRVVIASWGRP
jgi:hypothetical protein